MKESELRKHAKCSLCSELIGHTGIPIFWTVQVFRHGVDLSAIRRQDGLGMMLGNTALAQVMGPDEEMTKTLLGPVDLTLCESCALENDIIARAFEKAEESPSPEARDE